MLRICHSNDLSHLAHRLTDTLGQTTGQHPLQRELVVVQSSGMAIWLRQRIAERHGIAASLEFPLPAKLVWRVIRALVPDVPEHSPYEQSSMAWRLFALLHPQQALWSEASFAPLQDYLGDEADADSCLKRLRLARDIADLFDRYLVYRPDWMRLWRQAETADAVSQSQPWQPALWRHLTASIHATCAVDDRAELQYRALQLLTGGGAHLQQTLTDVLPPRISVFGISSMPPLQLQLLLALGEYLELHIYVFNPSQQYWNDIVSEPYLSRLISKETINTQTPPTHPYYDTGHPLLANLGRAGREFLNLLLEHGDHGVAEDDFIAPAQPQLLAHLQRDMLALSTPPAAQDRQAIDAGDDSLVFADCHGPMREMEALHDWLLGRFEADSTLTARDVAVLIPNINRYAPYVEAVFGSAQGSEAQIPYAISDRSMNRDAPVLHTLSRLLGLPQSRLGLGEVLDILNAPPVMRRFNLDAGQIEQVSRWLRDAGVRWGMDAEHWRQTGLTLAPESPPLANTWSFGIERMLLGYAMGNDETIFAQRLALPGMEGHTQALGGLLDFLAQIQQFRERLRGAHPAPTWAGHLRDLLAAFFQESEDDEIALAEVRRTIATLGNLDQYGVSEDLHLDAIAEILQPVLQAPAGSYRFLSGQVTFCDLVPMRNIPFRIVALAGMNWDEFPRKTAPLSMDLMARYPRRGDRAKRWEDRYLFLESLLAARQHLYISWCGHNPATGDALAPSPVVSELRDTIDQYFRHADADTDLLQAITCAHHLQPFSDGYGDAPPALVTYSSLWASGAPPAVQTQISGQQVLPAEAQQLRLGDLTNCLNNPCQYFLRQRAGAYFTDAGSMPDDSEPFQVQKGLDNYQVRSRALDDARRKDTGWQDREKLRGCLPHGKAARQQEIEDAQALIADLQKEMGALLSWPTETLPRQTTLAIPEFSGFCPDTEQLVNHFLQAGLLYRQPVLQVDEFSRQQPDAFISKLLEQAPEQHPLYMLWPAHLADERVEDDLPRVTLSGSITHCVSLPAPASGQQMHPCVVRAAAQPNAVREKHVLQLWLNHLLLCASWPDEQMTSCISLLAHKVDAKSGSTEAKGMHAFLPMPSSLAQTILGTYISLRRELLAAPPPMMPKTSHSFVESCMHPPFGTPAAKKQPTFSAQELIARALQASHTTWQKRDGKFSYGNDKDQPDVARLWRKFPGDGQDVAVRENFMRYALLTWIPLLASRVIIRFPDNTKAKGAATSKGTGTDKAAKKGKTPS